MRVVVSSFCEIFNCKGASLGGMLIKYVKGRSCCLVISFLTRKQLFAGKIDGILIN